MEIQQGAVLKVEKIKDPVFVAGCIDRVVRDKNLRQQMIEGERKRLKDFEYDSIAAMFKNYLNAFINRTK